MFTVAAAVLVDTAWDAVGLLVADIEDDWLMKKNGILYILYNPRTMAKLIIPDNIPLSNFPKWL